MARRRSKKTSTTTPILIAVGFVTLFLLEMIRKGHWWTFAQVATIAIAVLGAWVLFLRSTRCGYITYQGQPCRLAAPGELRGCKKYHKGLKMEALVNHLGLKHPRQHMQKAWMGAPAEPEPAPKPGKLEHPAYDITMLVATIFSAVSAVAMPIIQMVLA